MEIRKAKCQDIDKCAEIMVKAHKGKIDWTLKNARQRLAEFLEKGEHCYCVLLGGEIVGFAFCEEYTWTDGKVLFVGEVAVDPKHQGKGIGKGIMEFLFKTYRAKGFMSVDLISQKREKNVKFYKKLGFKEADLYYLESSLK